MLDQEQKKIFLQDAGWGGATETAVGEDWSQRHISRLEKNGRTVILMHSLPDDDPRLTPGHKPGDYVRLAALLKDINLSVPEIYAAAPDKGLLLVEDFGPLSFHDLLSSGDVDGDILYLAATSVLKRIYDETKDTALSLPDYYKGHIHTGRRRVIDWYAPAVRRRRNEDGLTEEYLSVWARIEGGLPQPPFCFLHGDFHPYNLIWLPGRDGVRRVGLIDFQGGLRGPSPYDLANLLRDARRIVPLHRQKVCLEAMLQGLTSAEQEKFSQWYTVLSCQFHCRVIGQALRLALVLGKTHLLSLIPVLQEQVRHDLELPFLQPLADFFARQNINFSEPPLLDIDALKPLIRDDAF